MKDNEVTGLLLVSLALTGLGALKLILDEFTTLMIMVMDCVKRLSDKYQAIKPQAKLLSEGSEGGGPKA